MYNFVSASKNGVVSIQGGSSKLKLWRNFLPDIPPQFSNQALEDTLEMPSPNTNPGQGIRVWDQPSLANASKLQ